MSFWRKPQTDGSCGVMVNRGDSRMSMYQTCGRKAEKDGLCSLHIKIDERRAKAADAYGAKIEMDKRIEAEGRALAKRLKCKEAAPYYNSHGSPRTWRYERSLIVPYDVIIKLLEDAGR